jgi:hypothetical protein
MNTSLPSALVRAYLAALGQIAAHVQQGLGKTKKPEGPPPRRRASDRNATAPQTR